MDERRAKTVAKVLGGEPWQSGAGIWLVLRRTAKGRIVAIADEIVMEYEDDDAFKNGKPKNSILMAR